MKFNLILISSISMILIDSIYLSLIGKSTFDDTVKEIQGTSIKINLIPAIITYIFMIILLNYFIISQKKSPIDAFILGLCTYGIFDFTNMTIFKNYSIKTGVIDTIWGAILFYIVTAITYKIEEL